MLPPMAMAKNERPRGRDTVRAALIDASAQLFSERGLRAVSVRELARAAGVNHGLVHRHFGSKIGLLQAVMDQLSAEVADGMGPPLDDEQLGDILENALGATSSRGLHWRILARAMLDGEDPADLQRSYPVVDRMLAAARRQPDSALSPEARVTALLALTLGMLLFTPYLRSATAQDDARWDQTRAEVRQFALQVLARI